MAYKNSDGKITIDENAALSDVRRSAEAEQILRETEQQLRALIAEAHHYKGETVSAIIEKAEEQLRLVRKLIRNLEDTQHYINKVVEHYKLVDRKNSEHLHASGGGFR